MFSVCLMRVSVSSWLLNLFLLLIVSLLHLSPPYAETHTTFPSHAPYDATTPTPRIASLVVVHVLGGRTAEEMLEDTREVCCTRGISSMPCGSRTSGINSARLDPNLESES